MVRGAHLMVNAKVNQRRCEALTSELNLELGWGAKAE